VTGPERKIQLECEQRLRALGWFVLRLVLPGRRGFPDTFAMKNGSVLFIEFKQPGGELSPQQEQVIEMLLRAGAVVLVAESWGDVEPYATPS